MDHLAEIEIKISQDKIRKKKKENMKKTNYQ